MANVRPALVARNAQLKSYRDQIDAGGAAGTIEIYDSTIPTNADTAVGAQVLLAVLTFSYPCAPDPSASTLTFSAVTQDSSANASGAAAWGRVKTSAGATVFDCSVTATGGGGVVTLNTVNILATGPVSITGGTLTAPLS